MPTGHIWVVHKMDILGGLNEWIQSFTPGRFSELSNVAADMTGDALFFAVWAVM